MKTRGARRVDTAKQAQLNWQLTQIAAAISTAETEAYQDGWDEGYAQGRQEGEDINAEA